MLEGHIKKSLHVVFDGIMTEVLLPNVEGIRAPMALHTMFMRKI
jgi:hypothetical protein